MDDRKNVMDSNGHWRGKWVVNLAVMMLCICIIWTGQGLIGILAAEGDVESAESESSTDTLSDLGEMIEPDLEEESPEMFSKVRSLEQTTSLKAAILEIGEYQEAVTMQPSATKFSEELRAAVHSDIENVDAAKVDRNVGGVQKVELYHVQISNKTTEDTLVRGINWALDNQVKLLQLPLLEQPHSMEQTEAIRQASNSGLILLQEVDIATSISLGNDHSVLRTISNFHTESTVLETYKQSRFLDIPGQSEELNASQIQPEIKLVSPENIRTLDTVLFLLDLDPSLTGEQIRNILTVSASPIGLIGDEFYIIDTARAAELVLLQNERKAGHEAENRKGMVTTSSATPPSITAPTVTSTSITWNVSYLTPNAWGNRLEIYNATTHQWIDISGTYYTQNGNYTVNNLTPGNTYLGRLTYYLNEWIVVDLWRTTTALHAPLLQLSGITDTSVKMHATFPANAVYGNKVSLFELGTNQWVYVTPNEYTPNGIYTFNGLKPGFNYVARLEWYNNGWHRREVQFSAMMQRKYEYDANGRLRFVRDHMSNLLATYHYDSNGNLRSVEKH